MPDDLGETLDWLTTLLAELAVPYQVVGGLAARAHGATRPLVDVDLYVPDEPSLARVAQAVPAHLTRAPSRHKDEYWDLEFLALLRGETRIEIAAASSARVWDFRAEAWAKAAIDFEASEERLVAGVPIWVMPRDQLVDHKLGLDREVDRLDIEQMAAAEPTPILEVCLETYDAELHSPLLQGWLRRPHVAQWWGDPELAMEESSGHSPDSHAVVVADGVPVGYLCWQSPPRELLAAAGLADLPEDLVDIDILIGEPEVIGRGVGRRCLGLLLARLRADPSVSAAGLGTSVSNERAIRAFERAGFRLFREFQDSEFGSCRYMVADVRDAE